MKEYVEIRDYEQNNIHITILSSTYLSYRLVDALIDQIQPSNDNLFTPLNLFVLLNYNNIKEL